MSREVAARLRSGRNVEAALLSYVHDMTALVLPNGMSPKSSRLVAQALFPCQVPVLLLLAPTRLLA